MTRERQNTANARTLGPVDKPTRKSGTRSGKALAGKVGLDARMATGALGERREFARKGVALIVSKVLAVKKDAPIPARTVRAVVEAAKNLDAGKVSAPVDFEKYRKFAE
jgi:hypothetical protein